MSIRSTGLLQSLAVIAHGNKFAVVAGGRRLAALQLLRSQGEIADDYSVPCTVLEDEQALEASLAENAMRVAMHPADQFEAFFALTKQGLGVADVAARFGVSDRIVEQRLKLARVAPAILKAYRAEETDLECVMAFAVVDDAKKQLKLWKSLPEHHRDNPRHIRDALTEDEIDASDRRVKFVTLAAYEQAGGATRRDLFTDGENGMFILQPDLLNDLVAAKLEEVRTEIAAEGWAWTEVREDFDYAERATFKRIHPEPQTFPAELQSELDTLEAERDRLYDAEDEDVSQRINEIDERISNIEDQQTFAWPQGTLENAGAVVTITYSGELDIVRGLAKPEDVKREAKAVKPKDPATLPQSLTRALRAQHSAALSAEMACNTKVALAAIVHALMCDVFYVGDDDASCLRITSNPGMPEDDTSHAWEVIAQIRTAWEQKLPKDSRALWSWCLEQEQPVLLDLLALCTALSINTVTFDDALFAKAVGLDMRHYFKPTATNFFGRVSKAHIMEALTGAKGALPPAWEKAKKSELALIAERELSETGWLPALLRAA